MLKRLFLFLFPLLLISCADKPKTLPESLGSLKRDKFLLGKEAKEFVNKMHISGDVAGERNEVGFYSKDTLRAILYVSEFKNSEEANKRLENMIIKIAHSETPFALHNQVNVQDKNIFLAFGMDQTHYIYVDGKKLIWLSADPPISLEVLHSLLKQKK